MSYKIANLTNSAISIGPFRFDAYEVKVLPDDVLAKSGSGLKQMEALKQQDKLAVSYTNDKTSGEGVGLAPGISTPFGQKLMLAENADDAKALLEVTGNGKGEGPAGIDSTGYDFQEFDGGVVKLIHTRMKVGGEDPGAGGMYVLEYTGVSGSGTHTLQSVNGVVGWVEIP